MKFSNSKRAINYLALLLVLFLSLNLNISCDTTEQQSKVKISLEAEDASCTEAWLNLKIESIALPIEITLFQGDSLLFTTNINSSDTTLFVENLLPNQNYSFYSTIEQFNNGTIKSNSISVTTMDTTSHNFSWETFEFGEQGTSFFKDVAIINENDIWAVGEIHTAETDQFDSNGVWVQPYNAVHWDGVKWELKRILYENNFWTINTIIAFNEDDIWFDVFVHWDGTKFNNEPIPNILMGWRSSALWGTTSQDFYVVGNGGNIAHYNGSSWTKIESGTDVPLVDIWSGDNGKTIWVSGLDYMGKTVLLKIKNNSSSIVFERESNNNTDNYYGSIRSIWSNSANNLFVLSSGGFYRNTYLDNKSKSILMFNDKLAWYDIVRGNDINDIIIGGLKSSILHFNGKTWREYEEILDDSKLGYNVSIRDNVAVIVGEIFVNQIYYKAFISIGKR